MQLKQKAFTLIEMLVVIAIIGVLAGIITLVISGARQKANATRAKEDLAQINKVLAMANAEGCTLLTIKNGKTNLKFSGTLPDGTMKEYTTIATPPSGFTYYLNFNSNIVSGSDGTVKEYSAPSGSENDPSFDSSAVAGCTGTPVEGEKYYLAIGGSDWSEINKPSMVIALNSNPAFCSKASGFSASNIYSCKNSGCFCSNSNGCND